MKNKVKLNCVVNFPGELEAKFTCANFRAAEMVCTELLFNNLSKGEKGFWKVFHEGVLIGSGCVIMPRKEVCRQ